MEKWTLRLGLSWMVMIGIWSSPLPAGPPLGPFDPEAPPYIPVYPAPLFVVPITPYAPLNHPPYPMPFAFPPPAQPAKHLYKRILNHFGMGCEANEDGNVGNFHSEVHWMYGSSRNFFQDYCVPCGQNHGRQ